MRHYYLAILLIFTSGLLSAQRSVALHSSNGAKMFSSVNAFVDAYAEAQNGDTIYIPGGAFAAPTTIDKQLYIYGAGYHPDSTLATNPTLITGNINLGENADNLMMEGFVFANQIVTGHNISASYLTFKRCRINGGFHFQGDGNNNLSTNNAFIECVILSDNNLVHLTNSTVQNSIIQDRILDSKSNIFTNNIFLYVPGSHYDGVLHRPYYNVLSNNIFPSNTYIVFTYGSSGHSNGNIYNNNIFADANPTYGSNPIIINNYTNIPANETFINIINNTFDYVQNYGLVSPETYTGNDNSQVGIYGGAFPFKKASVPVNPHISVKKIAAQTNLSGELQVEFKVSAQND